MARGSQPLDFMCKWMLSLIGLFLSFSLGATEAQVLSIDPCDALIRQKGNLDEVLKPRHHALDLLHRIQQGEELFILIGHDDQTEISIETAKTPERSPVMVKTHKDIRTAQRSSELYGQLKEFKSRGLLPGFQLFQFLERDDRKNIFKFEEGRELASLPGDIEDLSNPDLRALQRSYIIRLNHTRTALERAGATVEIYRPEGDLPYLMATHEGRSLLRISPYHIWVTIDGRFLIFDPL